MTVVVGLVLALVGGLSAQGRWQGPYDAGRRAVDQKRFQEAVGQLEKAIAIDSRQEANKQVEGVFRADYFPYYYLGIAYLELGNYPKAKENLDKAGDRLARNLVPTLENYRQRLAFAMNPPPPPTDAKFAGLIANADAALGARRYRDAISAFDAARAANAAEYGRQNAQVRRDQAARSLANELTEEGRALMTKSPSQARSRFEDAQRTFPGLKEPADLLATLRDADERYTAAKSGAEQDLAASNFQAAQQKFRDALQANPERYAADNLSAQMARADAGAATPGRGTGRGGGNVSVTTTPIGRTGLTPGGGGTGPAIPPVITPPPPPVKPDPNRMFEDAVRMSKDGQYAEAEAGYAAVVKVDPAHKQAAAALESSRRFGTLVGEGRAARNRGDAASARQRFEEAQKLDALRFNREGLVAVLAGLPGPTTVVDPARDSLRQGLEALLSGDAQRSISILEPTVRRGPAANASNTAALHAYLGVAYATRALASASSDEQTKLRADAIGQFRQALTADRSYTLSTRIVSPKILTMFEEAKR